MDDLIIWLSAVLLVILQLFSCIFPKRFWLRWLPFFVTVLTGLTFFVLYLLSDYSNWGFIILVALCGAVLFVQGAILLINRLVRAIARNGK